MTDPDPIRRAVAARDWTFLAGWCSGRWGVEVDPARLGAAVDDFWVDEATRELADRTRLVDLGLDASCLWSNGSWAMWLKNRVEEAAGKFPHGSAPRLGRLEVILHMGFLCVEELPWHLANLCRKDDTPVPGGPSTPGIERTLTSPEPIDRTAAKVVGLRTDSTEK